MLSLCSVLSTFRADRKGVAALEYALMAALVAVAIIGAVRLLGTNASSMFSFIASTV